MGANRFYQASVQNLSDQTNATANYADITGLALDLDPLDQVTFRFMVIFKQSNALDSVKLQFTTPLNPTVFAYNHRMFSQDSTNVPLVGVTVPQADTPYVSWSEGYIENGPNAGTLQMQFAAAAALGTVTAMKNSNATAWRVNP